MYLNLSYSVSLLTESLQSLGSSVMNDYTGNQMVFLRAITQLDMKTKDTIVKLAHNFNNECRKFPRSEG